MNKTLIWIILGIIVIGVLAFTFNNQDSEQSRDIAPDTTIPEGIPLNTDNNVFDEIDETLELLE
jgi:hypothetical protein